MNSDVDDGATAATACRAAEAIGHTARAEGVTRLVRYLVSENAATFTGGVFGTTPRSVSGFS